MERDRTGWPVAPGGTGPAEAARTTVDASLRGSWFQALYETPLLFSGILDARGRVLDGNELSIEGCGLVREEVLGRPFWTGGWWSPEPEVSTQIRRWCEHALTSGEPVRATSRYFVAGSQPRTVDLALTPLRGDEGDVTYLVATGLDITDAPATRHERGNRLSVESAALSRGAEASSRQLPQLPAAERRADRRLHRLVGIALDLAGAESLDDLTRIVVDGAVPVLGADGGAVLVWDGVGRMRLAISECLGRQAQESYAELPSDSPLPAAHAARTGERVLLPDRAAGLAFTPEMRSVYEATGRDCWAVFPLRVGAKVLGSLMICWPDPVDFDDDVLWMLEAVAAQCALALDRVQHRRAQRESALAVQRLSETLQRSLLTQPPTPDALDIAVRYQPAAHEAHVGGDWYDAFMTAAGHTMLVVGDVTGHDRVAVAAMGQLRNVLRGLAYDSDDSPAVVLARLDRALRGLRVGALASAVLARVEQSDSQRRRGVRRLRWSNAGHPPPLLRQPDGTVRILGGTGDLLLGVRPDAIRGERVADLVDGSTLLLYTDGLVERRDADIDQGIARLAELFARVGDRHPERICDALVGAADSQHEDDIALLVLRCGPVSAAVGGQPPSAGTLPETSG